MRTMCIPAMAIGAAALLTWSATPAAGQDTTAMSAQQAAQYVTDRLQSELDLTAAQVPKVQALNVTSAIAMKKLLDKYEADTTAAGDAAFVQGVVATVRSNQAELKKVLTPAQWTLHQQHRAERMALNQTEIMVSDLGLTRDQIPEVERINLAGANKLVRALDQPGGAAKRTRQQLLEAAKPAVEERDAELEQVLTVAQWKEMQQNRRALRDLFMQQVANAPAAPATAPKPER
jgi:uncharacterized protein YjiS (DUF1127 family)